MNQDLINKYSVPVPRYTSYPPANFFETSYCAEDFKKAIIDSNSLDSNNISIYIHIPYCFQMCYYCGCNAIQMKGRSEMNEYVEAVKKEISLVLPMISKNRKISQIHYGGGTPTSLPVEVLKELNDIFLSEFDCIDRPEIAIECHPGYMSEEYWKSLSNIGFNRVSIGIQDFNDTVLDTVNRKRSRLPLEDIVGWLRDQNISVNFDFIYGLPHQTEDSFVKTIEKAITLSPDRIVTFSYAHVPWVNPLQQKLDDAGLPAADEKAALFDVAVKMLHEAGYKSVGMDHFVRPDDELHLAVQQKQLHRNFQGYCTRRTTGQVYAFGVTGISQLSTSYSQNEKDVQSYIQKVDAGELPVIKGYALNRNEQIIRVVIENLMCNYIIRWNELAESLAVSVDDLKNTVNYDVNRLNVFVEDGLIEYNDDSLIVLPDAAPFVRNVAASLDPLLLNTDKRFSKSV